MIGIYKITNPKGKVYIGQSIDILARIYSHKTVKFHKNRLCHSINKYGFSNHTVNILEECSIEDLNERERYWQDFYDACGKNGLNCWLTKSSTKSGKCHDLVKEKISKSKMGYKSTLKGKPSKNKGMTYNRGYQEKLVFDLNMGIFYKSLSDAARFNNVHISTLRGYLTGRTKNKMPHLIISM